MRLLTIAITSFSRVLELERCIKSIDTKYINKVEIVVSEDCSPKKREITKLVTNLTKKIPYQVNFNSNNHNLGYDKNIKKLIDLSNSEYILFITDDDVFRAKSLDKIIYFLENNKPSFLLTPFFHEKHKNNQRKYYKSHIVNCGIESIKKYIFDSILVSGLIFKKSLLPEYDVNKFHKLIYSQVYLFSYLLYRYDGFYLDDVLIDCIEDGENAYGISKNNINEKLADRTKPISNLEFNKGLIKIIKIFDNDHNESLHRKFSFEYSLRSWTGLYESRKISQKEMNNFFKELIKLDVSFQYISYTYFIFLTLFGYKIAGNIFSLPRNIFFKLRKKVN